MFFRRKKTGGTFEESSMADLRRQFEVNVFGTVATVKAVLPGMRERRGGHIFVITSMGGHTTFPGLAFYEGSKHALEGITDTLAQEVGQFGVRVTAVAPGAFKTDWAGRSLVRAPRGIADYDALFDPIRTRRQSLAGQGVGDPDRAAGAILTILDVEKPPVHLLLGSDALRLVTAGRPTRPGRLRRLGGTQPLHRRHRRRSDSRLAPGHSPGSSR